MSTKTKAKTNRAKKENLETLPLPTLWARFKDATGESTKSPNKKFLVKRITASLASRAGEPAPAQATPPPAKRNARATEPTVATTEPATPTASDAPKPPRGRFATMTVEELQTKYLEVVGRSTGSDDRRYLIWKIREAEKGRINVGPRKTRERDGEPLEVKILPLRLEADVADKMDEAWRAKGIKNRMEFFRGAIGHYLAHLGARDAAALDATPVRVKIAGRMMTRRIMGKASFAHIQDMSGRMQLYVTREGVGEERYGEFKKWDLGDILGADGVLFKTKTGELSVRVHTVRLLTKSLRPLPDKWHGLADTETRYRQRYVDLIVNESSRNVFLSHDQRMRALSISRALREAGGIGDAGEAEAVMRRVVEAEGLEVEYAVVRDARTLLGAVLSGEGRALIAARIGKVRLIDNAAWLAA